MLAGVQSMCRGSLTQPVTVPLSERIDGATITGRCALSNAGTSMLSSTCQAQVVSVERSEAMSAFVAVRSYFTSTVTTSVAKVQS